MKKIFPVLLSVALFSIFVSSPIIPAFAQAETTDEKIEKTLDTRIQNYKKEHPSALTAAQLAKLKTVCKAAQVKTNAYTKTAVSLGDKRLKLYEGVATKIDAITQKVETYNSTAEKDKQLDLTNLKAQNSELKTKTAKFKVDLSTYQVALNDLSTLNCQELTDTFKSALEEVRETQKSLNTTSDEIQVIIGTQIPAELNTLKDKFEGKATTTTTEPTVEKEQQ